MNSSHMSLNLNEASDAQVFEEAARRLRQIYKREHGVSLCFGSFEFVFENGIFDSIDECQKNIIYQNPKRLRLVPNE